MRVAAYHDSRMLTEEELGPVLAECALCGRGPLLARGVAQKDPRVDLLECSYCRGVSVSRFPSVTALDSYYDTYYSQEASSAVTTDDPSRLARRIASYLDERESPVEILDFGGGDGSISVEVLASLGLTGDISLVDYDHRRRAHSPPGVSLTHLSELDKITPGADFQVVIASAVLEHLPDPMPVLTKLLELVRPSGVFYARTPYVVPLVRAASRVRIDIDFTFPAHLYDLGQDFWDRVQGWVPEAANFEVISSGPSPVETSARHHPVRTVVATTMKAPHRLLGSKWPFVGGWEWVVRRV